MLLKIHELWLPNFAEQLFEPFIHFSCSYLGAKSFVNHEYYVAVKKGSLLCLRFTYISMLRTGTGGEWSSLNQLLLMSHLTNYQVK